MHKADFDDIDTCRGSFAPFVAENVGSRWAKSLSEPGSHYADDIDAFRRCARCRKRKLSLCGPGEPGGARALGADDVKERTPGQERFAGDRGMGGGL